MKTLSSRGHSGFTLLELIVVMGVTLAIAAFAMPTITTMMSSMRLQTAASDLSGLLQRARMTAVQKNKTYSVLSASSRGEYAYYLDANGNGSIDSGEPTLEIARGVSAVTSGNPALSSDVLGFTPQTTGSTVRFNARGLPCLLSGNVCNSWDSSGAAVGFIFYFRDARTTGPDGWAAIAISPAGRIKVWNWNGTAWK